MILWHGVLALLMLCAVGTTESSGGKTCSEDDLQYVYTECEGDNSRWRVSVPKSGVVCTVINPKPPAPGPDCDWSCDVGKYLDIAGNQKCKSCPAGKYSMGNGVRYDQWDKLPDGFSTYTDATISFLERARTCNSSAASKTWVPKGQFIQGVADACRESLSLTVDLVNEGDLTISYVNTYSGVLGMVMVESLCQSTPVGQDSEFDNFHPLKSSKKDEFQTTTVNMKRGKNKITIGLMGLSGSSPQARFAIQSMEISGMPFATECTPCKAGCYSGEAAGHCTHCPENTYSPQPGASLCQMCEATHFAPPGSKECKPRPPCTDNDYYKSIAPCNNGSTQMTYTWLTPQYCNVNHTDSVSLPPPGDIQDCPPCNPGQSLNATTGRCSYCPNGTYSNGSMECQLCPLHTEARRSLVFNKFDTMPDRMFTSCLNLARGGSFCDEQNTWVPHDGYMQVSSSVGDEEFAVLNVNVSGLSNNSIDGRVYGTLSLTFDIQCEDSSCLMYLMELSHEVNSLHTWNKTSLNTRFTYNFYHHRVDVINLAFRKSLHTGNQPSKNTVKVYEISLSNTNEGGASECTECALGGSKDGCRSCAAGEIIVKNNVTNAKSCEKCPANHIKVDSFTCSACGPGLVSSADYKQCLSNCLYTSADGMKFNFTSLAGHQAFKGVNMFTADGTAYHQVFNIVPCTEGPKANAALVTCVNNATDSYYWEDAESVTSLVCRETILPAEAVLSLQPTNLGDTLIAVAVNDETSRQRLTAKGGVQIDKDELTIHYMYRTSELTESCSHGLSTTITLICDSREVGNGTKSLSPRCAGGTCDGCTYDLIWRTIAACPICALEDYEKIVGECVQGSQTIRYIPHKYCPMTDEVRNKMATQECTMLTLPIKIAIAVSAVVAVLLFTCAICCWKRSKKLEYKYMRLVEGAQGNAGELPAAQTCAWSDEEEEESDRVSFKTKGDQLFGKLGNKKGKGDGFEKMKLVGSSLPEI